MRYLYSMLCLISTAFPLHCLFAAELDAGSVAGTYAISICRKSCSSADKADVLVKGEIVLFAKGLEKEERDRFDPMRFNFIASGEPVNACFALEKVGASNIYAGIQKLGFSSWSRVGNGLQLSLMHSPDAGYQAKLEKALDELRGTGASWGAGMGAPQEHTQEIIVARRTGTPDLAKCIFETEEEAKLRTFRTDPLRNRVRELADSYRKKLSESLSVSVVPRDWVMSVLIGAPGVDLESRYRNSRAMAVRAAAVAQNDLLAQWVALYETHTSVEVVAEGEASLSLLQRLEPENAAVWVEPLSAAAKERDEAAVDAMLMRMASSSRYDGHLADIVKAKLEAYRRMTPSEEYFAAASQRDSGIDKQTAPYYFAEGYDTGMLVSSLPGLYHLFWVCRNALAPNRNAMRVDACAKIGRLMAERGSDTRVNMTGEQLLHEIGIYKDSDVDRSRVRAWIGAKYFEAYRALFYEMPVAEAKAQITDWCETGSEYEMQRRAVARASRPLQPPADWRDIASPYRDSAPSSSAHPVKPVASH